LAYGEQLLVRLPKRAFQGVPKARWTPLAITADERQHLIAGMNARDQAVYAFYAGDAERVLKLMANLDPAEATLEQMLLLAVTYDADDFRNSELARAWCERIVAQYPGSPWATFARKQIVGSERNRSSRRPE